MDDRDVVTIETSLAGLSDVVGKASEDLRAVRATLDLARTNIAARNTTISRDVVTQAESAVNHLREADESLRQVLQRLRERD